MRTSALFRVFISSTFADFKDERRVLDERVFPDLARFCEQRGGRFQAVDLRWGVANEAALDQSTLAICLGEVRRCVATSPRPSFVALIGDRYGWRPLPSTLSERVVERLRPALTEPARFDLWYRRDANALPPAYILQPRDPDGPAAGAAYWAQEEAALRTMLIAAARGAAPDLLADLDRSATEHEIRCFMEQGGEARAFAYFRAFGDPDRSTTVADPRFGDAGQDKATLERLRADIERWPQLEQRRLFARLDGAVPDAAYLETFARKVHADLLEALTEEFDRLEAIDPVAAERMQQEAYRAQRAGGFLGRDAAVAQILTQGSGAGGGRPLVVHGPGGMGKSALLASAIGRLSGEVTAVFRFVGATPASADPGALLQSLTDELAGIAGLAVDGVDQDARTRLTTMLAAAGAVRPIVLAIDALDQLPGGLPAWLPLNVPPAVTLILSVLDGPLRDSLAAVLPAECFLSLEPLDGDLAADLADRCVALAGRTLVPAQRDLLFDPVRASGSPLYCVLAAALAARWRSYDVLAELPGTVEGLIEEYLHSVADGRQHGALLGRTVIGLIAASTLGLSEIELHEILSSDPAVRAEFTQRSPNSPPTTRLPTIVLTRLINELRMFLIERLAGGEQLLDFSHRLFRDVARHALFGSPGAWEAQCRQLADYFDARPTWRDADAARRGEPVADLRKAAELWPQLAAAGDGERLAQRMTDFDQLMAACSTNMVAALGLAYDHMPAASTDAALRGWATFVHDALPLLVRGTADWPAHKILLQAAAEEPDASPLAVAADRWLAAGRCEWTWWRRLHRPAATEVRNASGGYLTGLPDAPEGIVETADGDLLGWASWIMAKTIADGAICRWDRHGRLRRLYSGLPKVFEVLEFGRGSIAARDAKQQFAIWDADGRQLLSRRFSRIICGMRAMADGRLIIWCRDGQLHIFEPSGHVAAVLPGPTERWFELNLVDGAILAWHKHGAAVMYDAALKALPITSGITATREIGHHAMFIGREDGSLSRLDAAGDTLLARFGHPIRALHGEHEAGGVTDDIQNRIIRDRTIRQQTGFVPEGQQIVDDGTLNLWRADRGAEPIGHSRAAFALNGDLIAWDPMEDAVAERWLQNGARVPLVAGRLDACFADGSVILSQGQFDAQHLYRVDVHAALSLWPAADAPSSGGSGRNLAIVDDDLALVADSSCNEGFCATADGATVGVIDGFSGSISSTSSWRLRDGRFVVADREGVTRLFTRNPLPTSRPKTAPTLYDRLYRIDADRFCGRERERTDLRFHDGDGRLIALAEGLRGYVHTGSRDFVHRSGTYIGETPDVAMLLLDRDGQTGGTFDFGAPIDSEGVVDMYEAVDGTVFVIGFPVDRAIPLSRLTITGRGDALQISALRTALRGIEHGPTRLLALPEGGYATLVGTPGGGAAMLLLDDRLALLKQVEAPAWGTLFALHDRLWAVGTATNVFLFDEAGTVLDNWPYDSRFSRSRDENLLADPRLRAYRPQPLSVGPGRHADLTVANADDDRRKIVIRARHVPHASFWHSRSGFMPNRSIAPDYRTLALNPHRIATVVDRQLLMLARYDGATRADPRPEPEPSQPPPRG